jgi:hypothetical protein
VALTWRSRVDRGDASFPQDEFWWFGELTKHRHYPFDNGEHSKDIGITLHTTGLVSPVDTDVQALQSLHERGVDLAVTEPPPDGVSGIRPDLDEIHLEEVVDSGQFPGQYRNVQFRTGLYGSLAWVPDDYYLISKLRVKDSGKQEKVKLIWPWLEAHESIGNQAFVTQDADLLEIRHELDSPHRVWILSPSEALDYIDAVLRMRDDYRIASLTKSSRYGYYEHRIEDLVPRLHQLHGIAARPREGSHLLELCRSLLDRLQFSLEAHDRIGECYYQPANLDSNDLALYHVNFLLLLVTSILDNIALLIKETFAFDIKSLVEISLQPAKKLRLRLSKDDAALSHRIERKDGLIELLYPLRHAVAHRLLVWSIGYTDEHTKNGMGLMEVTDQFAKDLSTLDDNPGRFYSQWGHRQIGELQLVEPYRFTRAVILEILDLANDVSRHLIEKLTDEPAAATSDRPHWLQFTIPFPRSIV